VSEKTLTADQVEFIFCSPLMKQIHERVVEMAQTGFPVFIAGDKGVGKTTFAQLIHQGSRPGKPFVRVSCHKMPAELQTREIFGQKRRWKRAHLDHPGKVQFARGGTLYVDEICEMTRAVQATLIQVLKDGKFFWPGSDKELDVDVRLVASTRQGLKKAKASGRLHEDWYNQLSAVEIEIPPLRQRKEDIPLLCAHFLETLRRRYDKTLNPLPDRLLKRFQTYQWDVENVKELEGTVKRYILGQQGAEWLGRKEIPGNWPPKDIRHKIP